MKITLILSLILIFSIPTVYARVQEEAVSIEDRVNQFVGLPEFYKSLDYLDVQYGHFGATLNQPWSGTYWPFVNGSIADPYALDGSQHPTYAENYDYNHERLANLRAHPGTLIPETLDNLSPAEKYDLYVGDSDLSLTRAVWSSVQTQAQKNGELKSWEGSCHGWAPASAYAPRPRFAFKVKSLDSRYDIPFYPDDIKALNTLLWANADQQSDAIVEGLRCSDKKPIGDPKSGRVQNTECRGVNPGVWHLALIGLVGAQKKSFMINRENGDEIWNQPITRYQFSYFNPLTHLEGSLEKTKVFLASMDDPWRAFRPRDATQLVSVKMRVDYASELGPTHEEENTDDNDSTGTLDLEYDLELNAQNEVLGGEWKWNSKEPIVYPGFMWVVPGAVPEPHTFFDGDVPEPGSSQYRSDTLVPLSKLAAEQTFTDDDAFETGPRPQPLAKVVKELNRLAQIASPKKAAPKFTEAKMIPSENPTEIAPAVTRRAAPRPRSRPAPRSRPVPRRSRP